VVEDDVVRRVLVATLPPVRVGLAAAALALVATPLGIVVAGAGHRQRAAWLADKSGRAIGVVDGGNVGAQTFTIEQCWDTGLATVYRRDVSGDETGDVGQCVTEAPTLE